MQCFYLFLNCLYPALFLNFLNCFIFSFYFSILNYVLVLHFKHTLPFKACLIIVIITFFYLQIVLWNWHIHSNNTCSLILFDENKGGEKCDGTVLEVLCVVVVLSLIKIIFFFFKAWLFLFVKQGEIVGDLKDYQTILFDEEIYLEDKLMETVQPHTTI